VKRLHIVTSCTDRKLQAVPDDLRLREIEESRLGHRMRYWTRRLMQTQESPVPVRQLYGGEHWTEFLKLIDSPPSGCTIQGWVISAGYGLLPVDGAVSPYAATFTRQSPDSVRPPSAVWSESDWWTTLADWPGPCGAPRRLSQLTDAPVLIAASDTYLRSVQPDLVRLLESTQPGRNTVFSSRAPAFLSARKEFVGYDSRLQGLFGGSKIGLNIRALAHALSQAPSGRTEDMRHVIAEAMASLPEPEYPIREAAPDDEVRAFIRSAIAESQSVRPTPLLRRWRAKSRACEQGRFRTLFWEEYQALNGQIGLELA
jgi:hypothetical protein